MKNMFAGWVLSLVAVCGHAAGFQQLEIARPGADPIPLAVWYPSAAPLQGLDMGAVTQQVAPGGDVAGKSLPLIVISHGNGGYQFSHYDTALALADAGFVVAALTHPGDNYADQSAALELLERPKHIVTVVDYMLKEWSQRNRIAPSRIGIFGFSSGGFTALVSIGGRPDLKKVYSHCTAHPADYACVLMAKQGQTSVVRQMEATSAMHDQRFRAAVIAAPALGFAFDANSLSKVDIPVQLWRAEDDSLLPHPFYADHVRRNLPRQPDYRVVPQAGHFDFLSPCSEKLAAIAPPICASAAGFDRVKFHRRFNADLVSHFKKFL